MTDAFSALPLKMDDPVTNAAAVTPSDTVDLAVTPRALWVGTTGNIAVIMNGVTVTLKGASGIVPIRCQRVKVTGTSAADIVALW